MTIGDNIKRLRDEHGLGQRELAEKLGVSIQAVSAWETGRKVPRMNMIQKIADTFMVSKAEIVEAEAPTGKRVPLIGLIACGTPILAEENILEYVCVPEKWKADFLLYCRGNSMAPQFLNGDYVAIRVQPYALTGQIAAVRIGDEATLKKVFQKPGYLELRPVNPDYESIILTGEEMETAHIEGIAVGLCRTV